MTCEAEARLKKCAPCTIPSLDFDRPIVDPFTLIDDLCNLLLLDLVGLLLELLAQGIQ